jgi:NAD(P)-dependent dehydrogenase (short-subunit alcohol dehydrogenase family)
MSNISVLGFPKSAALEYAARGIRINAICRGWAVPKKSRARYCGFAAMPRATDRSIAVGGRRVRHAVSGRLPGAGAEGRDFLLWVPGWVAAH